MTLYLLLAWTCRRQISMYEVIDAMPNSLLDSCSSQANYIPNDPTLL